jgi:hypothetical protein
MRKLPARPCLGPPRTQSAAPRPRKMSGRRTMRRLPPRRTPCPLLGLAARKDVRRAPTNMDYCSDWIAL